MRLEMARLAFSGMENAQVLDIEIKRGGKSYTSDTLSQLREIYPDDELYLLMGTDMYSTLDKWYNVEDILTKAVPAVFARQENEAQAIEHKSHVYRKKFGVDTRIIKADVCPISSSQLRQELPERLGTEYLQKQVYDYILVNRLYGVKPNFDHLRFAAYRMLDNKRIPHVAGCEQEAVRLALRWGEDVDSAREAAILHDITKRCDGKEQLLLCEKYGIITDNVEKQEHKLLHSKTGAAVARELFAVSDEVFGAIQCHTTGKPDMTLLEKIIYMADYIEPNRDFD
ncbi:MAG: bis(5'-nucleosyl)-tetraphosphatase (symmetrical) YqeK, partial [Oscillospiraceae bacterium]|nr:bis(5'-nucleosyl)-tetraphosphatase (symmetrical) YqeK [Oscillospiraceae bacterium]